MLSISFHSFYEMFQFIKVFNNKQIYQSVFNMQMTGGDTCCSLLSGPPRRYTIFVSLNQFSEIFARRWRDLKG